MTKRNRWLKKQERRKQRQKEQRKAYALKFAKWLHEGQNKIPFPSLVEDLRKYATGVQNIEAYRKAFGIDRSEPKTILPQ